MEPTWFSVLGFSFPRIQLILLRGILSGGVALWFPLAGGLRIRYHLTPRITLRDQPHANELQT